ncbi:HNH endonuclease [Streptomyces sp. NBC_01343]|uniref:hypothetical protein n=1 Tax=Streptomyces sp. NBC_01343 TaxID=2903832 RepID=UPI002E0F2F75|nr:HNH endonuclease [Streptomyces sp. NBC_01343]
MAQVEIGLYTPSLAEVDGVQQPVLIPQRRWYDALLSGAGDEPIARWNSKVFQDLDSETASTDCWSWTSTLSEDGYGRFSLGGQSAQAHHVLWALEHGSPPAYVYGPNGWERVHLGHLCHDRDEACGGGPQCFHRRCVNPEHLALQSQSENFRAGHAGEHERRKTHCPSGHEYTVDGFTYTDPAGKTRRYCRPCKSGLRAPQFVGSRRGLEVAA